MPIIAGFLFDDDNVEKLAFHRLSDEQVDQVLDSPYLVARNRKDQRASLLVIGRDHRGLCIAIPVEPTSDPEVWRPVTAWPCKTSESQRLQRARRR